RPKRSGIRSAPKHNTAMSENDLYILLCGFLVAINGSLLGTYLTLQKNALLSDAISHAVLPGILVAFMLSQSKASFPLLLGAVASGLFLTQAIFWLQEKAKMQKDAALGITYTFMFALGLILLNLYLGNIDLDAECVLFGEIAYVPVDLIQLPWIGLIPRALTLLVPSAAVCIAVVYLSKRPLFLSTFNPEFSQSIGLNVKRWQGILLTLTCLYTVMAFELIGAIMVVGFIIIPPVTAQLFSFNLKQMLVLSHVFGCLAVLIGYFVGYYLNISLTGTMVCTSGIILFLCLLVKNRRRKDLGNGRAEVFFQHQHKK
ncbi:MAG: metal ABC transporter permease, partial [Luteibaculum sp.]